MTPLSIAVVGVGALGRHHARILAEMDGVDLVAVADPNEEQGRSIAEAHGCRWHADYHDLPDDLDGVSIAAPTTLHLEVAATFLNRHIPVMVEKPLALNVGEAERLVRLAARRETRLQVGHVERFNPATVAARKLIKNPKYVRAERVAPFTFRSTDIGVTHDLMIHDVDLLLDLVEYAPLVRVEALGVSVFGRNEDIVQARLVFEGGCIADLTASRVNPTAGRTLQAWTTDGVVTADLFTREVVRYTPTEWLGGETGPLDLAADPEVDIVSLRDRVLGEFIEIERPEVPEADALTAELAEFIDGIRSGTEATVNGQRALAAMRVVESIQRAVANHPWDGNLLGPRGPFLNATDPLHRAA